jgi:hypothetical protein
MMMIKIILIIILTPVVAFLPLTAVVEKEMNYKKRIIFRKLTLVS